jgi:hypothetical protein
MSSTAPILISYDKGEEGHWCIYRQIYSHEHPPPRLGSRSFNANDEKRFGVLLREVQQAVARDGVLAELTRT